MIDVTECLRLVVTSTFVFTLDDYESDLTSEKSESNRFTSPIFNVRMQVVSRLIFQYGNEKFVVTIFKRLVSSEFFSKVVVIPSKAIIESYCSRFALRGSLQASLTTCKLSSGVSSLSATQTDVTHAATKKVIKFQVLGRYANLAFALTNFQSDIHRRR